MCPSTGQIGSMEELKALFPEREESYFKPVRTLTKMQDLNSKVEPYEPCPCGSGQKFKFCCHKEAVERKNREQAVAAAAHRLAALAEVRKGATY